MNDDTRRTLILRIRNTVPHHPRDIQKRESGECAFLEHTRHRTRGCGRRKMLSTTRCEDRRQLNNTQLSPPPREREIWHVGIKRISILLKTAILFGEKNATSQ